MKNSNIHELSYGMGFFALLLLTTGLYWTGLQSPFILDDEPNLQQLTYISQANTFEELGQFVIEGSAGPLGRPLSLLTFALQHHSWPRDPFSFKYVNLMLHLLNGCLIFWLALQLSRLVTSPPRSLQLALITTGLWLLAPMQVSTVLYVVQRMTQLATLFTLLGLIAYLQGRQYLAQKKLFTGYLWISLGISLGGLLAILSKENGVLLILYVLVLEVTLLRTLEQPLYWRYWFTTFIYLPLFALVMYFTVFTDVTASYSGRDFTLVERLLTETRVLTHYVAKILLLQSYDFGVFHDDYVLSHGLLTPPQTLLTTLLILICLITAIWWRRTYPIYAFGVLWFLAGHVLESSFIGLVIYFEHRNYLPMFGILFAVSYGGIHILTRMQVARLRWLSGIMLSLWLLFFPLITWLQTTLWAKPLEQAEIWAERKPHSRFAQSQAAFLFDAVGQYKRALARHQHMVKAFPEDTGPYMLWLSLVCRQPQTPLPDLQLMLHRFRHGIIDSAAISGLNDILLKRQAGECYIDTALLRYTFSELTQNPRALPELYQLYAMFLAQEKRYDTAILKLDEMPILKKDINVRLLRLRWLISAGRWQEALAYLQEIRAGLSPLEQRLYTTELDQLEKQISGFMSIDFLKFPDN